MNKSRLASTFKEYRSFIAVLTVLCMIVGFLCGRAILSLGMFLFGLNAIWDIPPAQWLRQRWWLLGLAWIGCYALSAFWSADIPYLMDRLQVKLPFLMLPLAFMLMPAMAPRHIRQLTLGMAFLLFCGCLYTLSFAWKDPRGTFDGYFTSKVMPTPAYKDHIRFSIFVAWFVLWSYYIFPFMKGRLQKSLLVAAIVFFTLFLHVLAVRSGLLFLYLFSISYIVYLFCSKRRLLAAGVAGALAGLIISAYVCIPSFHYKAGYIKYTFEEYERGRMSGNFSDMGRIISYQTAWKIFCSAPLTGVGAGDILAAMKLHYRSFDPDIKEEQILIPHNQIMVGGYSYGYCRSHSFPVLAFLSAGKIRKNRRSYFVLITWFCLLVSLCTEPMLEVQFGVFVYLFCLLWMMYQARLIGRYQEQAV